MKKLLSALCLLALCSSLAGATVPDPLNCTVSPLLGPLVNPLFPFDPVTNPQIPGMQVAFLAPGAINGTSITISVRNHDNAAIPNAAVSVVFSSQIKVCGVPAAVHTGTTNSLGICNITLKGGGCLSALVGACVVSANGVEIRNLAYVRSPDNGDNTTSLPNGAVTTSDLGFFGDEFKGTAPVGCHDYNNSGSVNTIDLGYFGDAFKLGTTCTLAP